MALTGPDILLYEKKGKIVFLTLNRPERMNALSGELFEALANAWGRFNEDDDAWVAVLTGAGEKAFSAGADLREAADRFSGGKSTPIRRGPLPTLGEGLDCWKPVIAAVNGFCVAGGWMLAQRCDVRIAAEHAEFGIAEARWNMPAHWIADLPKIIGLGHALEIALWADKRITAQRAYEIGFVNKVVPKERLLPEATEWAERMLDLAPLCVRDLKQTLYRGATLSSAEALAFGKAVQQRLLTSEDMKEGPKAFAEGRKPKYKAK